MNINVTFQITEFVDGFKSMFPDRKAFRENLSLFMQRIDFFHRPVIIK
jgi:hypothetical protein